MFSQRRLSTDGMEFDSACNTIPPKNLSVADTGRFKATVMHTQTQTLDMVVNHTSLSQKVAEQHESTLVFQKFDYLCQARAPMTVNNSRRSILPVFPELNDFDEFYPLLANISDAQLTEEERQLRTSNRYRGNSVEILLSAEDEIGYNIRNMLNSYSEKWNVDKDILIINLNRLFVIIPQLTLKNFMVKRQELKQKFCALSIQEWFMVLEIYLQMDVESFYMKTCGFRNSIFRSVQEGLFCMDEPSARYGIKQCRDKSCRFCYERLDLTDRFERAIDFSNNQVHYFVNNYQIYLNCDVTCTTSNVIYALTCPCHQYDYIGRCKVPFRDRMWQHRMNGCRIMSNFFIGSIVAERLQHEREGNPIISDGNTKLYEHSTTCPAALRMFLKCQPNYWCFVPMTRAQAMTHDANITSSERNILANYQIHDSIGVEEASSKHIRDPTLVRWCVNNLPQPPPTYQFSLRQRIGQYEFFRDRLDLFPTRFLDLYNAVILIALHEQCSDEMRHLVQALLVTHAEPKLNIIMNHGNDLILRPQDFTPYWCQTLIHPSLQSTLFQLT